MDWLWITLSALILLVGIIGCLVPLIPGPPLSFIGLLFLQLKEVAHFTLKFMVNCATITVLVTTADYFIPILGTKKLGGTRYGIWGCTLGLIVGFWFGPFGIILGPFVGAFVGELMGNASSQHAFRAALGSFVGFLLSTLLKLMASVMMIWYFFSAVL
jgi:uncharacterized protein YqgC (DUF456 family)